MAPVYDDDEEHLVEMEWVVCKECRADTEERKRLGITPLGLPMEWRGDLLEF
jgi:predicted metal-binding protein